MLMEAGCLYVVATPIGNLEDITARALRVLREVDLIASEDTRHSRRLLDHYGIATPLTSYHEHNEAQKAEELLALLEQGRNVALITDAGTPGVSDPGYRVVRGARERGLRVAAVPGPSALVAALSVSGLPTDRFAFHGFFPRKEGQANEALDRIKASGGTHVFFESPHRLAKTLQQVAARMPEAEVAVARELTKVYEEVMTGPAAELAERVAALDGVRGECVLMLHTSDETAPAEAWTDDALRARVERAMAEEGLSRRDAVRKVAADLGLPRNAVYAAATGDA
jgi:16S rRNA (cytidine1402-2'-O)-methyltransferase